MDAQDPRYGGFQRDGRQFFATNKLCTCCLTFLTLAQYIMSLLGAGVCAAERVLSTDLERIQEAYHAAYRPVLGRGDSNSLGQSGGGRIELP